MARHEQLVVDFALYEDGSEFLGVADVTLPSVSHLSETITGAGMGGNIDAVTPMIDAMEMTVNYRITTARSMQLMQPRRHNLDLRQVNQTEDPGAGTIENQAVKHVIVAIPKTDSHGSLKKAATQGGSVTMAVRYWATYIDGEKIRELDPMNYIYYENGVDHLEAVRKGLGK